MSHYILVVVGDDVHHQLEPFQENNNGDMPPEYLTISEELSVKKAQAEYNLVKNDYDSVDDYVRDKYDYTKKTEDGKFYGYEFNPNSKWDWYAIGGRWRGFFKPKPKAKGKVGDKASLGSSEKCWKNGVDVILKKDVDVEGMKKELRSRAEATLAEYMSAKNKIRRLTSDKELRVSLEIPLKMSAKDFLEYRSAWTPHAYLIDDEWIENGEMGWFGMVDGAKDTWHKKCEQIWTRIPNNATLTAVDCHI